MCHITLRVSGVGSRLYHLRYQRIGWGKMVRLGSAAHELSHVLLIARSTYRVGWEVRLGGGVRVSHT